jgi:hypothetical protein
MPDLSHGFRQAASSWWQKRRFSVPQFRRGGWFIKHLFSASAFVVKAATFAEPESDKQNTEIFFIQIIINFRLNQMEEPIKIHLL